MKRALRMLTLPVLLGLAAYFAVFGGEYSVFEVQRLQTERAEQARQLERLRAEIERLRIRVDSLETSDALLERIARERYGMIREGERLYRFVEVPAPRPPEPRRIRQARAGQ